MNALNKIQENKLTMYEAVLTLLQENESVLTPYDAMVTSKAEFSTLVGQIRAKGQERGTVTAGKAAGKQQAEDALIAALMEVTAPLYSYGRKSGKTDVKEVADVTEGKLTRMRDTELASRATTIHQKANAEIANLGNYGITVAMLTELQNKITVFSAAIGERESSAAARVGMTMSIAELFDKADEFLNEDFDRLMERVRNSDTEFYNKYFAARVIKDLGIRHEPEPTPPPPPTP